MEETQQEDNVVDSTVNSVIPSTTEQNEGHASENKAGDEKKVATVPLDEFVPDITELTLKNLDTGEKFIIGENDPDFDFDTFELKGGVEPTPIVSDTYVSLAQVNNETNEQAKTSECEKTSNTARKRWWMKLFDVIYGSKRSQRKEAVEAKLAHDFNVTEKPKTPFTKLSNFKFRKELGRGAFGRVLLAEAKTDGRQYALKIISKKNMRSSDKRQAKAERDILHAMTLKAPHPFTSGLKFAFQSENNLYLGMDFIPGGNLRELIKRFKCLPEDWVRFYAAELVLAISHLHSLNVLYRDIKPHNVMIDSRGHLILIDFGLSKQEIIHPRGALSLVGTPDYSAPEVLKTGVQQIEAHNRERAAGGTGGAKNKNGKKGSGVNGGGSSRVPRIGYGKAADWWSLGIMIYEMLSGTPTFRGADLRQTYQRILYADLEFFPAERFSLAARLLLSGLIKRDPSSRLGAWENPPQDIMSAPFFRGIEWDAIYERRFDGPYVPEVQSFSSTRQSTSTAKDPAFDAAAARFMSSADVATTNNEVADKSTTVDKVGAAVNTKRTSTAHDDIDDDDDDCLIGLRDSVIIRSKDGGGNNVTDWSFIDEKVLASSLHAPPPPPPCTSLESTAVLAMQPPANATTDNSSGPVLISGVGKEEVAPVGTNNKVTVEKTQAAAISGNTITIPKESNNVVGTPDCEHNLKDGAEVVRESGGDVRLVSTDGDQQFDLSVGARLEVSENTG